MRLGKYKKTLDDACTACGDLLQLRVVDNDIVARGHVLKTESKDQVVCVSCGEIKNVKPKKMKKRAKDDYDDGLSW